VPPPKVACAGGTVISGQCYCPNGEWNISGVCGTPQQTNGGGGNTTIINNYNNGTGSGSGGSGDGGQGVDICNAHPGIEACVVNAVQGGSDCNSPPICSGDQAQCSIALSAWRAACPPLPEHDYSDELAEEPTKAPDVADAHPFSMDGLLNGGQWLEGSGSCMQFDPIPINFAGFSSTFQIPDAFCAVSGIIGGLLVALAYFKAAQILLR